MSIAVTYLITLQTPALFAALEGEPNSAVSFDYVPGSVLRGMAVGAWMRQRNVNDLDATDPDAQRLFFTGITRWLNAYPDHRGERTLPIPQTWLRQKYGDRSIIYMQPESIRLIVSDSKPKTPSGFTWIDGDACSLIEPQHTLKIHVQRNRHFGRATSAFGQIYRYDSLAMGQKFAGVVICESETDADTVRALLQANTSATIGGARTAGYGQIAISDVRSEPRWHETPEAAKDEYLHITLLSDAILRDDDGQVRGDAPTLVTYLSRALGTPLNLEYAFMATQTVGGFNRKWGLPLPQVSAIRMGSEFIISGHADANDVAAIVEYGVGERRAEGFGRLSFNRLGVPPVLKIIGENAGKPQNADIPSPTIVPITTTTVSGAQRATHRLMLQYLERAAVADALDVQLREQTLKSSQINRLRAEVRKQLSSPQPVDDFSYFFDSLKETARNQFARQRIGQTRGVAAWITALTSPTAEVSAVKSKFQAVWTPGDSVRAKLLVIDAVLARLAKMSKEKRA